MKMKVHVAVTVVTFNRQLARFKYKLELEF